MKIAVIGGAGYIGSHTVRELLDRGHKVKVFDNLSSGLEQNLFKDAGFVKGDILHPEEIEAFLQEFKPRHNAKATMANNNFFITSKK